MNLYKRRPILKEPPFFSDEIPFEQRPSPFINLYNFDEHRIAAHRYSDDMAERDPSFLSARANSAVFIL